MGAGLQGSKSQALAYVHERLNVRVCVFWTVVATTLRVVIDHPGTVNLKATMRIYRGHKETEGVKVGM